MSTEVSDKPKVKMNIKTESEHESKTRPQPAIEMEGVSSVSGSPAAIKAGRNEGTLVTDKARKIGHRRVNEQGMVTYKKKGIIELKSPSALLTFSNEVCCKLLRHNTISRFIKHPSKKSTTELMSAIQLGIGQSITSLSSKPKRDLLLQDFSIVETVFFPKDGSSSTPPHEYSDFRFKTYAPVAFRYFRELFGIQPDDFLISLSNYPLKELSNPGASGSIFYITDDDEFIIKTVSNKEADFLQKLLPGYYMNLNQNPRTLLPKFYGLFCYQCGGKNIRFVVMNNLLPLSIKMHEKYDLKGSTYKRKASREERSKKSPTLKDLDFVTLHPEGIMLEGDTFSALLKTIERDCRVLQSFQIMDYSLLMSIHNLDQAVKERDAAKDSENESPTGQSGNASSGDNGGNSARITRGRSIHQRLAQFSTTMEAIHAKSEPLEIDEDEVPIGGIPARSFRGERLLLYIGIIDILQSYRLAKKLEHAVKSIVHDGDTISVHRPGFYAQRFQNFFSSTVFKKIPSLDQPQVKGAVRFKKLVQIALRHSPTSRKSLPGPGKGIAMAADNKMEFGGRPDVLPSATPPPTSSMADLNLASADKRYSSSLPVSMEMTRHLNSPAHTVGSTTASTPTHTSLTEGTPSYTASSPSCSTISTPSHMLDQQGTPINSLAAGDMDTRTISQSAAPIQQALAISNQSSVGIHLPDQSGEAMEGTDVDGLKLGTLSREVTESLLQMSNQISEEEVIVSTKL